MQIEVRPARPEEMDEIRQIAADTNLLPPDFIPQEFINGITPDMTLCAFVDGKAVTSYASWPFHIRFNGLPVGAGDRGRHGWHLTGIPSNGVFKEGTCKAL